MPTESCCWEFMGSTGQSQSVAPDPRKPWTLDLYLQPQPRFETRNTKPDRRHQRPSTEGRGLVSGPSKKHCSLLSRPCHILRPATKYVLRRIIYKDLYKDCSLPIVIACVYVYRSTHYIAIRNSMSILNMALQYFWT